MQLIFSPFQSIQMNVSIIGASGYSGAELLKILLSHRTVKMRRVFAHSNAGKRVDEIYGIFKGRTDLAFEQFSEDKIADSDIVFVALPSGEAMNIVPSLIKAGKRVIDLGGDFRLQNVTAYQQYYKREHTAQEILASATYGLPEWNGASIKKANLVANPGCYATSAILPLIPLLKEDLAEERGVMISSLSGVSGAGKSASLEYSFSEVNESVRAYKVGVHQHTPEIESAISNATGKDVSVTFVPHLIPITRGIYSSIYVRLKKRASLEEIAEIYHRSYSSAPFVRFDANVVPEIKNVNYTNYCDIGIRVDERNKTVVLLSVIDNLIKGAAGQAVQNMNLMFGLNETEGLL